MISLTVAPAQLHRNLFATADTDVRVVPPSVQPAQVEFDRTVLVSLLFVYFTPTATTATFFYDAPAGTLGSTGATVRDSLIQGGEMDIRHFRAWARRKPGTTGAIAAQTIIFKGKPSGTLTEVARINVLAAAAGDEPVSDFIDLTRVAGDARFTFDETNIFTITLDAVDTDLEICFEASGSN